MIITSNELHQFIPVFMTLTAFRHQRQVGNAKLRVAHFYPFCTVTTTYVGIMYIISFITFIVNIAFKEILSVFFCFLLEKTITLIFY